MKSEIKTEEMKAAAALARELESALLENRIDTKSANRLGAICARYIANFGRKSAANDSREIDRLNRALAADGPQIEAAASELRATREARERPE